MSDDKYAVTITDDMRKSSITMSPLFTQAELSELAQRHGVETEVAELVSEMLRIIECRRINMKP